MTDLALPSSTPSWFKPLAPAGDYSLLSDQERDIKGRQALRAADRLVSVAPERGKLGEKGELFQDMILAIKNHGRSVAAANATRSEKSAARAAALADKGEDGSQGAVEAALAQLRIAIAVLDPARVKDALAGPRKVLFGLVTRDPAPAFLRECARAQAGIEAAVKVLIVAKRELEKDTRALEEERREIERAQHDARLHLFVLVEMARHLEERLATAPAPVADALRVAIEEAKATADSLRLVGTMNITAHQTCQNGLDLNRMLGGSADQASVAAAGALRQAAEVAQRRKLMAGTQREAAKLTKAMGGSAASGSDRAEAARTFDAFSRASASLESLGSLASAAGAAPALPSPEASEDRATA